MAHTSRIRMYWCILSARCVKNTVPTSTQFMHCRLKCNLLHECNTTVILSKLFCQFASLPSSTTAVFYMIITYSIEIKGKIVECSKQPPCGKMPWFPKTSISWKTKELSIEMTVARQILITLHGISAIKASFMGWKEVFAVFFMSVSSSLFVQHSLMC